MSKPAIFDDFPMPVPWGPYRFVVASVYDGDTCSGWVSMGLDTYVWLDVRLADVRAPEMKSKDLEERAHAACARDHLTTLTPPGTQLLMRTEKVEGANEQATLGRYVAWLLREDGLDVNRAMQDWLEVMGYEGGF